MLNIKGSVAVITGGGSGIGEAVAKYWVTHGGSVVVGPDGEFIAEAPMFDEALRVATIDLADLRRQRLITPLARDERLLVTIEELNRIKRRHYGS